ncbi:MFS general substrate transporter [Irpex rosettiformis]|uniref:MFS general substrate transporter n=1 Tax=Irpex rosettiformis TaxID=378272 RepID=A0ACB8TZV8_9APHY|nr:MFS general substrate transporter [Irpex rosettiformis]
MSDNPLQVDAFRAVDSVDEEKGNGSQLSPSADLSYNDSVVGSKQDDAVHLARAWRKMDYTVLPIVTIIFFLCFLDKGNIGNARIAGLQKDLHMSNYQYSLAITITFLPYIVIELPSNLWLKRIGPNIVLPLMALLWGVATTLQGTVTSYGGLIACRFFIGLFEGMLCGLPPGCMLYLSSFYPRQQLQLRMSIFFAAPTVSGAFSGLLASAILHMEGIGGKRGWAWVFILEGLFTTLFGFFALFVLPRTPSHVRLLTTEEKELVNRVLHDESSYDLSEKDNKVRWKDVWYTLKLPQLWFIGMFGSFFNGASISGLTYFTPSIVASLGYTANRAQLMSVPPFAVAFVLAIASSYFADRYAKRGLVMIIFALLGITGFGIFLGSHHPHARYASLSLILPGTYAIAPPLVTWTANNCHSPYTTRATSIALLAVTTNSGGIFSTWLLGSWSKPPGYTAGAWVLMMFQVGIGLCSAGCWWVLARSNRQKGTRYIM